MIGQPSTVADILDRAARLLEQPGVWGQGRIGSPYYGNKHCADTAICRMAQTADTKLRSAARRFFAEHVGAHDHWGTYRWNDAPERTQAEVVAKLREAAAKAREGKDA